jgi:NTP pyrophosphatase (non-canonical NTP hydrolase)
MEGNTYQAQAARTINLQLNDYETEMHALHGMAAELGEIHEHYQKKFQGHDFDEAKIEDEVGDLLWFLCEYLTSRGLQLDGVMQSNIHKLELRYPKGFSERRSKERVV